MATDREAEALELLNWARSYHSLDVEWRYSLEHNGGSNSQFRVVDQDILFRQRQVRRAIAIIRYERRKYGRESNPR